MYGQPDGVETPVSHAPNSQPRREFQPRADLEGTYSPYWDGKSPKPYGDRSINVDRGTRPVAETEEEKEARLKRESSQTIQNEKNYKKLFNKQESEDRRRYQPSDMGVRKAGEVGTDEDDPEVNYHEGIDQDDDPLEGFQVMKHADKEIVKRNQERVEKAIAEGRLGTIENPAPASIIDGEVDHNVGVDFGKGDDLDKNFEPLEEKFGNAKPRESLSVVNIENDGREYFTRVDLNRISNHRQKDWLKHNGGENLVREVWNNASFVEVMVRPHGETQMVIHEAAKDGHDGRELRLDVDDFFAMFSIPEVNDGKSRFQSKSFHLNNPADEIRLKTFFEKVKLNGQKIGAKKEGTPPIIKITPWSPMEATKIQRDLAAGKPVGFTNDYFDNRQNVKPWNDVNLNGKAYDKPAWPRDVEEQERRKKDLMAHERYDKKLQQRLAEEEKKRREHVKANLIRIVDKAREENKKIEV